jgi:hypothetical protein
MRAMRALMTATAVVLALPNVAVAQTGRPFNNAWFWGIKGGGMTLADSGGAYTGAPTVGVDWMITRTHGGLYVSGSQTFFKQQTFTLRDPAALDSGVRVIDLNNMRRLDVAMVGFPGEHLRLHPYVGIGLSMRQIGDARPRGPFSNVDQFLFAEAVIADEKVSFAPLFLGGAQYRVRYFSIFGQMTLTPTEKNFILYNGRPWNAGMEFGIRYNFGSSISQD